MTDYTYRLQDQHYLNSHHLYMSGAITQVILATECAKWMDAQGQQLSA
jgi:hypothetical protein